MMSQHNPDRPVAPGFLCLSPGEVHVWCVRLDQEIPAYAGATLSSDERERASRFAFPDVRRRFVAARAALRAILGEYLDVHPADLAFSYTDRGKPYLSVGTTIGSVAFNLSHSETLALCAVTDAHMVGVDVEHIRADPNRFQPLERFFSPSESAALRELDVSVRLHACYACWTQKEAFLKACGQGLSLPLDAFDVSCTPDIPARILAIRSPLVETQQWTVASVRPAETFIGAVVVEGAECRIRQMHWQWPMKASPVQPENRGYAMAERTLLNE